MTDAERLAGIKTKLTLPNIDDIHWLCVKDATWLLDQIAQRDRVIEAARSVLGRMTRGGQILRRIEGEAIQIDDAARGK
jgi:hypothetical protein